MKNLLDTIPMMGSKDFKERFKAEYWQLKIRTEKLGEMCEKYAAGELDFKPNCSLELLQEQLGYMKNYLSCLELRAEIEDIYIFDLPEVGGCEDAAAENEGEKKFPRILIYEKDGEFVMDIPADMEITKAYEMTLFAMIESNAEEEKKMGLPEGSLFMIRLQQMLDNLK